jgi:hypothetical protein
MSSSLRSRDIKDYFEADFSLLRAEETIPIAIHLYFPSTNHVLLCGTAE